MKKLYQIAVNAVQKVYKFNFDLGTVEFDITNIKYQDEDIQVLSIAGSNELLDWFQNINLLSWSGIKLAGYLAARKIYNSTPFEILRDSEKPLLITGHSKSGPTAIAFKRKYGCDWLVVFAPAPSLRRWINREMENTTIFIDPDDIVHKAGIINFGHPICEVVWGEDDHKGICLKDHRIEHWVEFVDGMED